LSLLRAFDFPPSQRLHENLFLLGKGKAFRFMLEMPIIVEVFRKPLRQKYMPANESAQ
jgi:hypothetical protein